MLRVKSVVHVLYAVPLIEDLPERNSHLGQVGAIGESSALRVFDVEFSDDEVRAYTSPALNTR